MGTEYRPEQMRAAEILEKVFLPQQKIIKLEFEVTDLQPIDTLSCPYCCLDIVILDGLAPADGGGIAIRMQGSIHERHIKRIKDADQRIVLEGNGWKVVDFWYYEMPNLWSKERNSDVEAGTLLEILKKVEKFL